MRLYRSLAYPIIGLIVLAVFGTAVPLYYIQGRVLKATLRAAEWARVESHHNIIKSNITEVGERALSFVKVLKDHDSLRNATAYFLNSGGFEANGDRGPLRKVMDNLSLWEHVDEIIVTDLEGRVISRARSQEEGDILSGWGVAEALAGEAILVTTSYNGKWEIRGVSPLLMDNQPIGVIVVASRIDDNFTSKLSYAFSCSVSLGNLKGIIASSLPRKQRSDIDIDLMVQALRENTAKRKDYPDLSKTAYYAPLQAVDEIFCLIVETDTNASDALLARKRKETFVFSFLILIITSILAAAFAFKLIKPIRKLKAKAEAITRDIAVEQFEDVKGNEVENLVHVFDSMVEAINRHIAE
ncbi:MAG TPA: cache domain-containing protein, partial [Acidobacteriota bacterium]|nr:cache domain-containing protein [Acidobacteriota bacterium]